MSKEGKIGVEEAIFLFTIIISVKVFFTSPALVIQLVGTAGWYMVLISALTGLIGFTFIYFFMKRFPDKNIMEAYDLALGKFFGSIFSFCLFFILAVTCFINLREFTDVLKVFIYPDSPPVYLVSFLFLTVVIVFSFLGLETISRYAKLIGYFLLIGFLAVIALGSQNYSLYRIFPILGNGIETTISHGVKRGSVYGDILMLAVFASSLQGINHIKKAGFLSIILSGLIWSISLLAFTLTFPYYTGEEITAPMYLLASLIDYGDFLQRVESIFLFVWILGSLIAISTYFYTTLVIYSHIFKIEDKKPLVIPYGIIIFTLSFMPRSIVEVSTVYLQSLREYGWILFYLPPVLALIVAKFRKIGGAKNA